jgi:hypothetical protein
MLGSDSWRRSLRDTASSRDGHAEHQAGPLHVDPCSARDAITGKRLLGQVLLEEHLVDLLETAGLVSI